MQLRFLSEYVFDHIFDKMKKVLWDQPRLRSANLDFLINKLLLLICNRLFGVYTHLYKTSSNFMQLFLTPCSLKCRITIFGVNLGKKHQRTCEDNIRLARIKFSLLLKLQSQEIFTSGFPITCPLLGAFIGALATLLKIQTLLYSNYNCKNKNSSCRR